MPPALGISAPRARVGVSSNLHWGAVPGQQHHWGTSTKTPGLHRTDTLSSFPAWNGVWAFSGGGLARYSARGLQSRAESSLEGKSKELCWGCSPTGKVTRGKAGATLRNSAMISKAEAVTSAADLIKNG